MTVRRTLLAFLAALILGFSGPYIYAAVHIAWDARSTECLFRDGGCPNGEVK